MRARSGGSHWNSHVNYQSEDSHLNTPVLKNTPGVEDVPELLGRVDDGGHAVPQDDAVPGMQGHAAIEDVQEQLNDSL